jgi:hypothetical protein
MDKKKCFVCYTLNVLEYSYIKVRFGGIEKAPGGCV